VRKRADSRRPSTGNRQETRRGANSLVASNADSLNALRPRGPNRAAKIIEDSNDLEQYYSGVTCFSIEQVRPRIPLNPFKTIGAQPEALFVTDLGVVGNDLKQEMPAK
jgi:hypothetical protein